VNDAEALEFARTHVETWNTHDLDAIVALYAESAEHVSPLAASLRGEAGLRGHEAPREYFAQGLAKYPELRFEIVRVFRCQSSVTIVYYGAGRKLVAEVMHLGPGHKIEHVYAHYLCTPSDNV
jgi:hypothetical protein